MNANRILGFVEYVTLVSLGGLVLCLVFAGGVQAEEDGWLVRQKNASPNGQWFLREDGSTGRVTPNLSTRIGRIATSPSFGGLAKLEGVPKKPEMLDPYGKSKDDRLEVCGNRGRPVRGCEMGEEEPAPEPAPVPQTFSSTNYLYFDWQTYYAIVNPSLYGLTLEMLGYTPEEIAFLKSLSGTQQAEAWRQGYAAMPAVEKPLLPISELNLSQVVNYAGATNTDPSSYYAKVTGSTVEYAVSFTNPYNEPLTVTISATIQYTPPASDSTLGRGTVYTTNPYYFQNYQLDSYALAGESTQVWQNVTLEPGETLVLNDTYSASGQTYGPCGFNYGLTCHYGDGVINIGYTIGVTVTDAKTGTAYSNPAAGWFNASSQTFGYGYDYSGGYLYDLHQAAIS